MKILTKEEIREDVSYSICVGFVDYLNEDEGFLGSFPTKYESREASLIDGDAILVYTIEYHGKSYYKFMSAINNELGPLYLAFETQDREDPSFGSELKNMRNFKRYYVSKFDQIFHDTKIPTITTLPNSVIVSTDDIFADVGIPNDN